MPNSDFLHNFDPISVGYGDIRGIFIVVLNGFES
jgi:hypothetical protein